YLRLGRNLTACYPLNCQQKLPSLKEVEDGIFAWQFHEAEHDWGYPNNVDMTLYRKKDIKVMLNHIEYKRPNSLEGRWASLSSIVLNKVGLCFDTSKIVNVPLNKVQDEYNNRAMNFMTTEQFLNIFNTGKKIDISLLYKIENESAHIDFIPM